MPGGAVPLAATTDVNRIEAPVTWKAYLMCAFASFGGIFFGYDSGYINGVLGTERFIHAVTGAPLSQFHGNSHDPTIPSSHTSLIVSILSCGTFFGAIIAGDVSDMIGRKWTIIMGCGIYIVGMLLSCSQCAAFLDAPITRPGIVKARSQRTVQETLTLSRCHFANR